jgi:general secretion pathway protein G
MCNHLLRKERGFTLIELMVVILILGMIVGIAMPNLLKNREIARKVATESELRSIQSALEMYYIENDEYPSTDEGVKLLVDERYLDEGALKDGFKRAYNYEGVAVADVEDQDYHLSSSGADGIKETEDDIQSPIGDHGFVEREECGNAQSPQPLPGRKFISE